MQKILDVKENPALFWKLELVNLDKDMTSTHQSLTRIDVVGLYPHIPHGDGLEAPREAFIKAENELPVDELISLARVVLENNFFEFDEKIFRQKLGTAIGTKFAPGFANIFMGYLEEKFFSTCEFKPWVWWRFLDDVFIYGFIPRRN